MTDVDDGTTRRTPFKHTDVGNAERLVSMYGRDLHYLHEHKKWHIWDGRRWPVDRTGEINRRAVQTVRSMYRDTAECDDYDDRAALRAHAGKSEAHPRLRAMVELAKSLPDIPVTSEHLDVDPWLFNAANGTIDLRTGLLRPHARADLITKISPVAFNPKAKAPTWLAFLDRVLDGDQAVIDFLQRVLGYSLTGFTKEQVLVLLWGLGQNGKSTFLEVVRYVAGEYAQHTPTDTLMATKQNGVPNDIARLRGARFVTAIEADEGRRFNESLIKRVTGDEVLTARFMHSEFFEFRPDFTLWLATNHKPKVAGTDDAIWRRILLVPFTVKIPAAERNLHLEDELRAEAEGILAWIVEGAIAWQTGGLQPPDQVRHATQGYRAEQDTLAQFLADCCVISDTAWATAADLFAAYTGWCDGTGEKPLSQKALGTKFTERGLESGYTGGQGGTTRKRTWKGIGLADADHDDPEQMDLP